MKKATIFSWIWLGVAALGLFWDRDVLVIIGVVCSTVWMAADSVPSIFAQAVLDARDALQREDQKP